MCNTATRSGLHLPHRSGFTRWKGGRCVLTLALALTLLLFAAPSPASAQPSAPPAAGKGQKNASIDVIVELARPISNQERGQLTRRGLRFYDPLSPTSFLAKVRQPALAGLQNHPLVVAITPVPADRKLSPTLSAGAPREHAMEDDGAVSLYVRFYEDTTLGAAVSTLRRLGFRVPQPGRLLYNQRLLAIGTLEQVGLLAASPLVRYVTEIPPPPKSDNATAASLSNVDVIQGSPSNLDGSGVVMGIWDGGPVRTSHENFGGRVTIRENDEDMSDHATHVAGTMIGSGAFNANARGMAPAGGQLFSWDFRDDTTSEQADSVANDGIVIANHSWGTILGWNDDGENTGNSDLFGAYNDTAADWDDLVRDTGLIVVKSAGNDGNDCNPAMTVCDGILGSDGFRYDIVGTHGNAKNIITVGAIQDNGTTATGFSSAGPSDDGRFKPDIVANGDGLTSSCFGSDSHYCSKSGTSMSAPTVSGTAALLVQRYRQKIEADPSPDVIKALMVNSAIDIGRPGPDYLYGFGLLDAEAAEATIDVLPVRILTGAVANGETHEYILALPSGESDLRVTLNWIDPAGAPNDGAPDLVNNLDLRLIDPNGVVYFPFTGPGMGNVTGLATTTGPNNVDTVEHIRASSPSGFWKVRVTGTAVSGTQNYALVANQSFSLPTEPDIRINASLDFNEVCVSSGYEDRQVTIFNTGGADLYVNSVAVTSGGAHFSVLPHPSQPFIVKPGAHVDVTVRYDPASTGLHAGVLTISSNDADEPSIQLAMSGEGGTWELEALMTSGGDYGMVCIGDRRDLDLELANSGVCDLVVNSIVSSSAHFKTATVLSYPFVVPAGGSITVPMRFEPTGAPGSKNGTITVNYGSGLTLVFPVSGTSDPGDINVSGSTDFGDVCADTVAEKTITVCNTGNCPLNVASASIDNAEFTIVSNPFPAVIQSGACLEIVVRFTPTSNGPKSATLTIVSDDPDENPVELTLTGNTPETVIAVPATPVFPPTVIQSVGDCESVRPVPITNGGSCPLVITGIEITGPDAAEFSVRGIAMVFPISVPAGHVLGEGHFAVAFRPLVVDRARHAQLEITYLSDPVAGIEETIVIPLCGEGVRTGARVLVTEAGAPVGSVERIQLQRITANRNRDLVDTVDNSRNLPLVTVPADPSCLPFSYHKEYGTESNPVQLLPGSYQVTATIIDAGGRRRSKTVAFDVNTCSFNPDIVVGF
jgi:hypothetical protein